MANLDRMKIDVGQYIDLYGNILMKQLLYSSPSLKHFITLKRPAQAGTTVMLPNLDLGEVWQSFSPEFTEKGNLNIGAETTVQRRHKVNVGLDPDVLNGEWSGQKTLDGVELIDETKDRANMTLPAFAMKKIIERIGHDRELSVLMTGSYVQPVPGTESTAKSSCDGVLKIMNDATVNEIKYGYRISTGTTVPKLEPFSMGAIPTGAGEVYRYIKDFRNRIPEIFREQPIKIFASRSICDRYADDKKETSNFKGQFSEGLKVDGSNMTLHPIPGLAGFQTVFASFHQNLVRIIHKNDGPENNIKVNDAEIYKLKIAGDFHECYGIANWDYFWSNDQIPTL